MRQNKSDLVLEIESLRKYNSELLNKLTAMEERIKIVKQLLEDNARISLGPQIK